MITNQLREHEQLSNYALSKLKFRKNFAYFGFILLLSGDINLHSGRIKHPRNICSKAVKKDKYHASNAAYGFTKNVYKSQGGLKLIITH